VQRAQVEVEMHPPIKVNDRQVPIDDHSASRRTAVQGNDMRC
jgi:hypothetical protein